ncbi:MAG: hypothetical protein JOZ41_09290 [Chloroflexi bacterium]|nr:hypothetical protein [Chloroflexota bacterium]
MSQALERLARPHPLILILDDLHWADEATFQLLHFLLRQPSLSRVSLIGAYRVEEVVRESPLARLVSSLGQGQGAPARGATLGLPPFERKDLSVLLEILLSGPCAPSLVESLYERSEGNPFFTKQMVSLLRQQERLEQGEAGWRIMQGAQVDLPPAVRETVTRRLRHLTAQQREVLTFGAVLGREFPYAALEAMWGRDEAGLFSALDAAVEAQLIGETESGYSFHHPLLREAIYSQVPRARRPLVHGRAGLALETLYVRSPEEHAAELAHHFHLAGRIHPERALLYLTLAGDHAAAAYASREAAAYYHAALTYAQEPRATADLQVKLGNTLTHLSQYDRALTLLEEAAAAYRQLGARADEGRAVAHIGRVHVDRGTAVEGTERVEGAVRSLEGAAPTEDAVAALGRLHGILFHLYAMSDRPEQSSPAAEEEVGYARRLADDRAMASAELHRGMALLIVGRQREALRAMEDIAPLVEKVGNLDLQAQLSLCLGQAYLTGGEVGRSKPHVERDLQLARMRRGPDQIAFYMSNLCEVLHLAGDWRLARELGLQALDLVRSEGRSWYAAYPPLQLGRLALYEGAWQDAAQRFAEALAIAEPGRDVQAMKAAALGLGELDLLQGRPHAALERLIPLLERLGREGPEVEAIWGAVAWAHLGMADSAHAAEAVAHGVELATRRNNRLILPDLLRVHGMVLSHERACRRAHEAFDEATRLAHAMPYPYAEGRALYEHGRMLAEAGDIEEARTRWTQALCIFRRLGARPYSALTERAISAITA